MKGMRNGSGGLAAAPAAALGSDGRVFAIGDTIGLLVDMDSRTLTLHRNGTPIPSLEFTSLPEQVYVVATPVWHGASVEFVRKQ